MTAAVPDAVVVGAGPAGSITAMRLAAAGVSVVLLDGMRFPRGKACGDLLSPRALEALSNLGLRLDGALPVGDMLLRGPSGRSIRLPWPRGASYPDRAAVVPRAVFDEHLRCAALAAGA